MVTLSLTLGTGWALGLRGHAQAQQRGAERRPLPAILPPPFPQRPVPPVTVSQVGLQAELDASIATVEVTYTLKNTGPAQGEADFVFPIPSGASVREFALYDGAQKLEARLLDKNEATRVYEEIVRQRRDPALLSYVGQSVLRARVFPVPAGGERRVTLKLVVVLAREGGLSQFTWALAGPHLPGGIRPGAVTVRLTARGTSSLYSPTHDLKLTTLESKTPTLIAEWSSTGNEAALSEHPELSVYLGRKDERAVALSLLAYNASLPQVATIGGGIAQSGYFLVTATPNLPKPALKDLPPRRVVLVMDRSGSMQGKKIEQARSALKFAVGKLRPQDHFNIVTFSEKVELFAPEPVLATPENLTRAEAFISEIVADSGTNINDALVTGLKQFPERGSGNRLLFFTDGLPTVGVKEHKAILTNALAACQSRARCFVFGVGYDVDVPFLDRVASKLQGDADYVRPDEDIEVKTSQFVAKTSNAVLENLKVRIEGVRAGELYPRPDALPDLFEGGQLVLVGRYTGQGTSRITLTGEVLGKPQSFTLETKLAPVATEASFLPRLWASRKIGHLLDEIRDETDPARKKEIEEQVIALSKEFGILTPYTALFVPEPGTEGLSFDLSGRRVPGALPPGASGGFAGGGFATKSELRTGESAVNLSQSARGGRAQNQAGNLAAITLQSGVERKRAEAQLQKIQYAGNRAFYQRGVAWEDGTYDPKKQTELVKIKLYSDAYFALVRRSPDWAKWAAVGQSVLVVANSRQAIQFGEEGKEKLTEKELGALLSK